MALTSNDATLIALASALGGAIVSGVFTLAGARFNHKHEAKREKERADREDRREQERAERLSRERLDDHRRIECVRLISSAGFLMATGPVPKEQLAQSVLAKLLSAMTDVHDAAQALQLFGPASLALAAYKFHFEAQLYSNEGGKGGLEGYTKALDEFKQAAKTALRYDR